ncbi:MAG: hypothetical protein Kow0037_12590 [Calditrichia bacterium]
MFRKIKEKFGKPPILLLSNFFDSLPFLKIRIAKLYWVDCDFARMDFPNPDIPGILREGQPDDLEAMVRCNPKREKFMERFDRGDRVMLAVADSGEVMGYTWFSVQPQIVENLYNIIVSLPPDAGYLYDTFVNPKFRKKGLWLALRVEVAKVLKAEGRRRYGGIIVLGNKRSFALNFKFGFRVNKEYLVFKWGKRSRVFEKEIPHTKELAARLTR